LVLADLDEDQVDDWGDDNKDNLIGLEDDEWGEAFRTLLTAA
jgi:hypothetical protein